MHKQIAVNLTKSIYQVAESVRAGQVSQRRRLNREAFRRYIQEQTEPVEGRCGSRAAGERSVGTISGEAIGAWRLTMSEYLQQHG